MPTSRKLPKQPLSLGPFAPSASLLVKLGSLICHYREMCSYGGVGVAVPFDRAAIATLEQDPEVIEWFAAMNKLAMLPVKR